MKILVCVRQVPDYDAAAVAANLPGTAGDASVAYRMNRFDEFAVEESLRIREATSGVVIDAVSAGPEGVVPVIRRAMEMGADSGILLRHAGGLYLNPYQTASLLQRHARSGAYDLILCGAMSEDAMHGQTGPMLAEMLDMPCLTSVIALRVNHGGAFAYAEREIEGGERECYEVGLPAVFTVQSGINRPRYPSLSNVLRAKSSAITVIDAGDDWIAAPGETVAGMYRPEKTRAAVMIEGDTRGKARELLKVLHKHSLL